MSAETNRRLSGSDWLFPLLAGLVFLVCLFYVLAYTFVSPPYAGISINDAWVVNHIDRCSAHPGWCDANADGLVALQVGDELTAIGTLTYREYATDRRLVPFGGYGPGDWIVLTRLRGTERQSIRWHMPQVTAGNRVLRLVSFAFCLPFWLVGSAIGLFLRPRDERWRLLVAFNYLAAVWVVVGVLSTWRVAGSSLVLHALTWLLAPVCVHLHLQVPEALLGRRSRWAFYPLYAVALVAAGLELLQLVPVSLCYVGLSVAIVASLVLLLWRLVGRSSLAARVAARLMLAGFVVAFGPGVTMWLIPALLDATPPSDLVLTISTLSIPALPFFYMYAIYKRHLGGLEFRANHLVGTYSFIVLYSTAVATVFLIGNQRLGLGRDATAFGVVVSVGFAIVAIPTFRRYQRWIARLTYGASHSPDQLLPTFALRIAAMCDEQALASVLAEEVTPSLMIRQSALCLLDGDGITALYSRGVDEGEIPDSRQQVQALLESTGRYSAPSEQPDGEDSWVRLTVPLKAGDRVLAAWLLGRRDPDDYYPRGDITLLHALGSQVAVALENVRLLSETEKQRSELAALSAQLLTVQEEERIELSNQLHEHVGANLSALNLYLAAVEKQMPPDGGPGLPSLRECRRLVEESSKFIRDLTDEQRLSVLNDYGLAAALEWHAARFSKGTGVTVTVQGDESSGRAAVPVERALFRIAQEALLNVMKHAEATHVTVTLEWAVDALRLVIEDDGVGLSSERRIDAGGGQGWGMLVMRERALSVGGDLTIESAPEWGTRITVEVRP